MKKEALFILHGSKSVCSPMLGKCDSSEAVVKNLFGKLVIFLTALVSLLNPARIPNKHILMLSATWQGRE